MIECPKCCERMNVTGTYSSSVDAQTQRLECPNPKCLYVCASLTFIVREAPTRGQGAYSLAKRIDKKALEALKEAAMRV